MTDKKLRKLNKTELLWIIRDQEAEISELKEKLGIVDEEASEEENLTEENPDGKKTNIDEG